MTLLRQQPDAWTVTLVDTGEQTQIGGRIKRILPHVESDEAFCLTYGDGVGDVDIRALIDQHRRDGRLATVTAMQPPGRFGAIRYEGRQVLGFQEKPQGDGGWINGGFFVCSPRSDATSTVTIPSGSASQWNGSPRMDSWVSTSTRDFGNPWTPCETVGTWRNCGNRAARPGRSGLGHSRSGKRFLE